MMDNNMISGKWINKYTGNIINVRNSVMDGDTIILVTDVGTIDMDEFAKNYIQASDELYDMNGNIVSNTQPVSVNEIIQPTQQVKMYNDDPTPRNVGYIGTNVNQLDVNLGASDVIRTLSDTTENNKSKTKKSDNWYLIDKLFNKINYEPNIKVVFDVTNLPVDKLKMLIDIYDVSIDEISEYINDTYISKDNLIQSVNESILTVLK